MKGHTRKCWAQWSRIRIWPFPWEAESMGQLFLRYCVGFSTGLGEGRWKGWIAFCLGLWDHDTFHKEGQDGSQNTTKGWVCCIVYRVLVLRLGVCRASTSSVGATSFLKFCFNQLPGFATPETVQPPGPHRKAIPPEHPPTGQPLTHIGPTECLPQWPGSHVNSLPVNCEWLHTALKTSVCSCCSDQPVSTGSTTKIERRPEGNFTVLAL